MRDKALTLATEEPHARGQYTLESGLRQARPAPPARRPNPFGSEQLDTVKEEALCVPSALAVEG